MSLELTAIAKPRTGASKWAHTMFDLFLRGLATLFFAATIYAWLRIIGYWEGDANRFDTMMNAQKIFAAIMVVLLPVASVGLWTTLSWGRVVWLLAVSIQVLAYLRINALIGLPDELAIFHAVSIGIYIIFQVLLYFIDKKA